MTKPIILWKSMEAGLLSGHDKSKWTLHEWREVKEDLVMCSNGFHASPFIPQAMRYVDCELIAKVEVGGKSVRECDKEVWQRMRVLKCWKWDKRSSLQLCYYVLGRVLRVVNVADFVQQRKIILRIRRLLKKELSAPGSVTQDEWSAAESAAWSAAESAESAAGSAAGSAESAAWSAAESAALSAAGSAESAAGSAAGSAESAAGSAAWSAESAEYKTIHNYIKKNILPTLEEEKNYS